MSTQSDRGGGMNEELTFFLIVGFFFSWAVGVLLMEWPTLVWSTLHGDPSLLHPGRLLGCAWDWLLLREGWPADWEGLIAPWPVMVVLDALLLFGLLLLGSSLFMRWELWGGRNRKHLASLDPRKRAQARPFAAPRDWAHLRPDPEQACGGAVARALSGPVRPLAGERRRPQPRGGDGWNMGRLRHREMRSAPEQHLLLVAPTRSGKTMRVVGTEAHEHDGPCVITSNKLDVVHHTIEARRRRGPVWVFAPLTDHPFERATWSPLPGCEYRDRALRMAQWIFDAHPTASEASSGSDGARFYNREAVETLLPALIQATALRRGSMSEVLGWLRGGIDALDEPRRVLEDVADMDRVMPDPTGVANAAPSAEALAGVQAMDDRARSLLFMSAAQLISAYRDPKIQAVDQRGFFPEDLLDENGTIYLIAPEGESELLAPVFGGILGSILRECEQRASRVPDPAGLPLLKILADEAAHLAPLAKLPTYLSVSAGWGVRWLVVYQSIAQLRARYGVAADAVIANALCKLYLGPIHDASTREELIGLLGDEWVEQTSKSTNRWGETTTTRHEQPRPKLGAEQLAQLGGGDAIAFHGRDLPALVHLPFWWEWQDARSPQEALKKALVANSDPEAQLRRLRRQLGNAGGDGA